MKYIILVTCLILVTNRSAPPPPPKPELNLTVEVNYTWDNGCDQSTTVKNFAENKTQNIHVGTCDEGPIYWAYINPQDAPYGDQCHPKMNVSCVQVFFRSRVIVDTYPPCCAFDYDKTSISAQGCSIEDSIDGYYTTSYKFSVNPVPNQQKCLAEMHKLCPDLEHKPGCQACIHKFTKKLGPICRGTGSGKIYCGDGIISQLLSPIGDLKLALPEEDPNLKKCLEAMSKLCIGLEHKPGCQACIHKFNDKLKPLCKGTGAGQKYCGAEVNENKRFFQQFLSIK